MQLVEIGADPDVRFSAWLAVSRMQPAQASADRRAEAAKG
jgi:hypothetical protein